MKHKIKSKITQIAENPNTKKALLSIKPQKNLWGISGVVFFFILPEIVAYIWGGDIVNYAKNELLQSSDFLQKQYFELLIMLFEEGVSYFNLAIGITLLVWLLF